MADSKRASARKELERASGNLTWSAEHISRVLSLFAETLIQMGENNQEPSSDFIEQGEVLNSAVETIATLVTVVDTMKEIL